MTSTQARAELAQYPGGNLRSAKAYAAQVNWTRATLKLLAREPHFPTPAPDYAKHTFVSVYGDSDLRPDPWKQTVYALLRKGA